MTLTAQRYRPSYFTGHPEEFATYSTREELLSVSWIHPWQTGHTKDRFHQWSRSENHLVAELDGGGVWFVVAVIDPETPQDWFPEWKFKKGAE